jgi:hypothetical protein
MKTDREKNGFRGPVHNVRTEGELLPSKSYRVNPGGLELLEVFHSDHYGQRNLYELFVFDESGRLLEEASVENFTDQESFRFVYTYDEAGRIIQRDEYDQSGSAVGKTIYTYDSKGRKVEKTYFSATGNGTRHTKFDKRENPVEMTWYGPDGEVISKDIWDYGYNFSDARIEETWSHRSELHRVPSGYGLSVCLETSQLNSMPMNNSRRSTGESLSMIMQAMWWRRWSTIRMGQSFVGKSLMPVER